ncbi:MAG: hypothetical protein KA214_05375 [Neisseriaceae bacterium]|nr:hypothetical protein [Neisseriaceae bacterium]
MERELDYLESCIVKMAAKMNDLTLANQALSAQVARVQAEKEQLMLDSNQALDALQNSAEQTIQALKARNETLLATIAQSAEEVRALMNRLPTSSSEEPEA